MLDISGTPSQTWRSIKNSIKTSPKSALYRVWKQTWGFLSDFVVLQAEKRSLIRCRESNVRVTTPPPEIHSEDVNLTPRKPTIINGSRVWTRNLWLRTRKCSVSMMKKTQQIGRSTPKVVLTGECLVALLEYLMNKSINQTSPPQKSWAQGGSARRTAGQVFQAEVWFFLNMHAGEAGSPSNIVFFLTFVLPSKLLEFRWQQHCIGRGRRARPLWTFCVDLTLICLINGAWPVGGTFEEFCWQPWASHLV